MVRTLICISRLIDFSCHDGEIVHFTDIWFSLYVVETDVRVALSKKRFPDANHVQEPFHFLSEETLSFVTLSFIRLLTNLICPLETKHSSFLRSVDCNTYLLSKGEEGEGPTDLETCMERCYVKYEQDIFTPVHGRRL